ncbi:DUF4097 family beta strand repeat-containing protein [Actinomadura parmotrematis]|uniref:DUF4097 domain-containing protein n=1 Tax=Actinomadura parmotrematis TaxID=2864039 RepID=A0ABS7FWR4_9ACTN|nr:DUF4097 family beta strand repeat-containing protein [Actinomadura parmotrematis]MBW8483893.1 DUF4097 domain-containing protein [Actinomadura parmotrematis]
MTASRALAIGTLAAAALAAAGCAAQFGTRHGTASYTVAGAVTAVVLDGDQDIEITGSDDPGVAVTERLSWSNGRNRPRPEHRVSGGTLHLSARCKGAVLGGSRCGVAYRVRLPRATALRVQGGDGDVTVTGMGGDLRLASGSGAVRARDLRARSLYATAGDGDVRVSGQATAAVLRTGSGSVVASALRAGTVTAHAGDGSLNLSFAAPPDGVDASTGSGQVRIALPQAAYRVVTHTGSGHVDVDPAVHRDTASARTIAVRAGDGSIRIETA